MSNWLVLAAVVFFFGRTARAASPCFNGSVTKRLTLTISRLRVDGWLAREFSSPPA